MFNNRQNHQSYQRNQGSQDYREDRHTRAGHAVPRARTPEEIWRLANEPMLRMQDVPGASVLAQQHMLAPQDVHLSDAFELVVQHQMSKAMAAGDAFWPSYPPRGELPVLEHGRVPICTLITEEILSLHTQDIPKNVLVVGPTGSGKTNWLRILIASLLREGEAA